MSSISSISNVFADRNRDTRLMDIDIDAVEAVDPQAATILRNTTEILKTVLDRRAELDAQGLQDTPLIVTLGENHNNPSHILRNILFTRGLAEHAQDFSVGRERPHNLLTHLIQNQGDIKVRPVGQKIIDHVDKDGALALKANFKSFKQQNAPYSDKVLDHTLLSTGVKARFVDAAIKEDPRFADLPESQRKAFQLADSHITADELDLSDKSTRDIAQEALKASQITEDINAVGPDGMHIRNQHMLSALTKSPISVLFVGDNHVLGFTPENNEQATIQTAKQGIATLAKQSGYPVLAVTISDKNINLDHGLTPETEIITHRNMPKYETGDDMHKIWMHENIYESNEANWVNTRLNNMGLASLIPDNPLELTGQYRVELGSLINVIKTVQSHPMHQTTDDDHTLEI